MSVHETDRSSIILYQKCPRAYYWERVFGGKGIQKKSKGLALQFGSAFHEGAESLLKGDVEGAVVRAINYLNLAFSVDGVDMGDEKATVYGAEEQRAIVEGLIRAWWTSQGERFLQDFEVLEIEQEGRAELASGIVLLFRPDALVRERLTGDLYIVSWKTASTFGQYTVNQIQSDMQSMSEVWGVQQSWQQQFDDFKETLTMYKFDYTHRIEGVLYIFAVKGSRRMDDYLGFKTQDTPLAYGWMRKGVTEDEDEWAWRYKWQTEEINPKTGRPVSTQLGKGFRKVSIWDNYPGGVKEWIADLAAQRITPRHVNALDAIFPQSMPVSRREDEIESWRRQVVVQEARVKYHTSCVEANPQMLDDFFPQHTARCFDYQARCQFYECCFTPAVKADPLGSGLYQIRVSNHPEKSGGNEE